MKWQHRGLDSTDALVTTLSGLASPEDGKRFRAAHRKGHPNLSVEECDQDLGYLTGYLSRSDGVRVRRHLGLVYPPTGTIDPTDAQILASGIAMGQALKEGKSIEEVWAAACAAEAARLNLPKDGD